MELWEGLGERAQPLITHCVLGGLYQRKPSAKKPAKQITRQYQTKSKAPVIILRFSLGRFPWKAHAPS